MSQSLPTFLVLSRLFQLIIAVQLSLVHFLQKHNLHV